MARTRGIAAVSLTVLVLLGMTVAPAAAGGPTDEVRAKAEHARIVRYWTAERIAGARPRDFERQADGSFRLKADKPARGKPGGGGGTTGGTVTGASWTAGGPALQRTGKVLFTMDGSNWVCSASVVNDSRSTYSLVLTAGHCAYDEVNKAFATNWTYVPSFDTAPTFTCSQATYGCWTAAALVVHSGFATAGAFNEQATLHDFAIAVVGAGGKSPASQLDSLLGSYSIAYPAISTGASVHAFGYPAAGKYKGNDLTYCAGPTFLDGWNSNQTWGIACKMTGGSSGGPWLGGFNVTTGIGTLTSLNSYGYSGVSNMYGPRFNADTSAVVNAANAATANTIVQ
jgi:hypothetical protein